MYFSTEYLITKRVKREQFLTACLKKVHFVGASRRTPDGTLDPVLLWVATRCFMDRSGSSHYSQLVAAAGMGSRRPR